MRLSDQRRQPSRYQPTPYLSAYGATKSFVLSFTEGLWEEARGTGMKVLAISPGAIATEFFRNSRGRSRLWDQEGDTTRRCRTCARYVGPPLCPAVDYLQRSRLGASDQVFYLVSRLCA